MELNTIHINKIKKYNDTCTLKSKLLWFHKVKLVNSVNGIITPTMEEEK